MTRDDDPPIVAVAAETTLKDREYNADAASPPQPIHKTQRSEYDEDEDEDEDEDGIPAEFRAHFPASFGGGVRHRQFAAPKSSPHPPSGNGGGTRAPSISKHQIDGEEQGHLDLELEEPGIGPPRPPAIDAFEADGNDEDYGDDDEGCQHTGTHANTNDAWHVPISSEASLEAHARAVVALAWDDSGSRLLSGSTDYSVKIFDFGGMKSDCRAFRSITPSDGHPIMALSWSPTSDAFLAVTGSSQPKIYDREGKELGEMPRGDMYIRDMKNTKGHVAPCSGGTWHPTDRGTGLTCSDDGTLRVWDLWGLEQRTVIKPTLVRPGRIAVTSCCYNSEGKLIAGGLMDGTLQLWDVRGKFGQSAAVGVVAQPKAQAIAKQTWTCVSRTGQLLRGAHAPDNEITCLRFSILDGGHSLLSRGADDSMKLWDIRSFKKPVAVVDGLPTGYPTTTCCFSPDEKLVLTGIGMEGKGRGSGSIDAGSGALAIFDRRDLSLVRRLGMQGSVVAVTWHPRLNQIALGRGDRKEGSVQVLYDPSMSVRGALMALGRRTRKENIGDFVVSGFRALLLSFGSICSVPCFRRVVIFPQSMMHSFITNPLQAEADLPIYNPNALPLYRDNWPGSKRRAQEDLSVRTSKSFKPDTGQAGIGVGAGGKLGASGGSLLTQYVLKHQGMLKNPAEEDVRASILRHAGKEDEFSAFTAAYAKTQPQRIYATGGSDGEQEEENGDQ
jgi:WD repeat-containing protein 70